MSARSGSARSRGALEGAPPRRPGRRGASRAIASSSRAATTQDGWTPTRETEPSRTGARRGRRRLRVVLGEPQRRQGDAHLYARALAGVQARPGRLRRGRCHPSPTRACSMSGPRRRREDVRRDERGRQPLGGLDVSQRLLVTAHERARAGRGHSGGISRWRVRPRSAGSAPGALEPPLCLRQPALADHHAGEYRVGDAGGLVLAPAVPPAPARSPACSAALPTPRTGRPRLPPRAPGLGARGRAARFRRARATPLLQVPVGLLRPARRRPRRC